MTDTLRFRAPGRVNLIGDHTDYNEGFVLPLAIDLECVIEGRPSGDGLVRIRSDADSAAIEVPADGSQDPRSVSPPWGRYVAGVVSKLARHGREDVGLEARVTSTVPLGAGLSSSAALEVAVALALAAVSDLELTPLELALACQEAEQTATGVPCGIMDQLTSVAGVEGSALLIDCRSLDVQPLALPDGLAVVVVHSGISRTLAGSAYAERREACERAAQSLGLRSLRDATAAQVALDPPARHVVSENARVLAAAEALRSGDVASLGRLLHESHASLRDDFVVSTPELDLLAAALEHAGALGARLTGAGFGGCVVALAELDRATAVAAAATERYRAETGLTPVVYLPRASAGAGALA